MPRAPRTKTDWTSGYEYLVQRLPGTSERYRITDPRTNETIELSRQQHDKRFGNLAKQGFRSRYEQQQKRYTLVTSKHGFKRREYHGRYKTFKGVSNAIARAYTGMKISGINTSDVFWAVKFRVSVDCGDEPTEEWFSTALFIEQLNSVETIEEAYNQEIVTSFKPNCQSTLLYMQFVLYLP